MGWGGASKEANTATRSCGTLALKLTHHRNGSPSTGSAGCPASRAARHAGRSPGRAQAHPPTRYQATGRPPPSNGQAARTHSAAQRPFGLTYRRPRWEVGHTASRQRRGRHPPGRQGRGHRPPDGGERPVGRQERKHARDAGDTGAPPGDKGSGRSSTLTWLESCCQPLPLFLVRLRRASRVAISPHAGATRAPTGRPVATPQPGAERHTKVPDAPTEPASDERYERHLSVKISPVSPTLHIMRAHKTADQAPFATGSRIATHSTWCVIGKRSKTRRVRTL